MAEKCDTPSCLRGVGAIGQICMPCEKGMPPMTNPKSPHAWNNPIGSATTGSTSKKPKSQDKVKSEPKPKVVIPKTAKWKKDKSDMEIKRLQRNAVELIFTTYWYGWPKGIPGAFTDIFKDYGVFLTGREVPSKMVGTPDIHKSHINMRGNAAFVIIMEAIYPIQGESWAFKEIQDSQILMEALGGVSATHAIELVKHDGESYTFTKKDEKIYTWVENGVKREIPKWAIA